jgi:hypothetical protein
MIPDLRFSSRLLFAFTLIALLAAAPAWAQSGSDRSGSGSDVSGSDVAGALSQASRLAGASFASPAVQQRVNTAARSIQQRLNRGQLLTSTSTAAAAAAPAPRLAQLLSTPNGTPETTAYVSGELQAHGIAPDRADDLVDAVAGLMAGGSVEATALLQAASAFNAVVEEAPVDFLLSPPDSFIVIRDVLTVLLDASSTP